MSVQRMWVDEQEYPIAPIEPEHHEHPTSMHLMAVTPEVARSWLKYNYRNRTQRKGAKADYSSDMSNGRFDINGNSVTFSRPLAAGEDELIPAGHVVLVDGQHRLESCIISGAPFVVYVGYGLKPTARRTVDTGVKRKLSDVFSMEGELYSAVLSSVTKRAYAWETGDKHLAARKGGFTHAQAEEFLTAHPELRRSAEIAARTRGAFFNTTGQELRQSVTALAHWLFMQADESRAPEFFARLGDGASLSFEHPISVLRRRLVKDRNDRSRAVLVRDAPVVPDWRMICYFIRSWNVYLAGPDSDGKYPEFALVGRSDRKQMPAIKTAASIGKDEDERLAELEKQETSS